MSLSCPGPGGYTTELGVPAGPGKPGKSGNLKNCLVIKSGKVRES